MTSPFSTSWKSYVELGWEVVPIIPNRKVVAASGVTGRLGSPLTEDEAQQWADAEQDYGIALRMPVGMIAVDVDAYDGKNGAITLASLIAKCGPLPPTWRNSSRNGDLISGHYFYRVPTDFKGRSDLGEDSGIELVQPHHRYAVCSPTIHHKTGTVYKWWKPAGNESEPPSNSEITAWLPEPWLVELRKKERERTASPDVEMTVEIQAWARDLVKRKLGYLSKVKRGSRHNETFKVALLLGRLVARECLTESTAHGLLEKACKNFDFYDYDTYEDGIQYGIEGPHEPWPPVYSEEQFWESREWLGRLRQFSRARIVAPWGTLAVTLARVAATIGPEIVLPPLVGHDSGLNLFVALEGHSGGGKGGVDGCSRDAFRIEDEPATLPIGSGEGLSAAYVRMVPAAGAGDNRRAAHHEPYNYRAIFTAPEIATIGALKMRGGSTLMESLRRAWSGEVLGYFNRDPEKRLVVAAGTYRLCLITGVQPDAAGVLLSKEEVRVGTPQRFLWASTVDVDAPEEDVVCPEPWYWQLPPFENVEWGGVTVRRMHFGLCDSATEAIKNSARQRVRRGTGDLDGHWLLCRERVAAVFAVIDGRWDINEDDWSLSGAVMDHSGRVRNELSKGLAGLAARENEAAGFARGKQESIVKAVVAASQVKRVAEKIAKKLEGTDWLTRTELNGKLSSPDRSYVTDAIDQLLAQRTIESESYVSSKDREVVRYRKL